MASDRDIVARHVGQRIRELREARGIAPRTLADHLDISVAELDRFESGEERIAPNLLGTMARLCRVGIDWFFRDAPPGDHTMIAPSDDDTVGRFMALPEAPKMMRAFIAIPDWEGRQTVVNFARMFASQAR